MNPLSVAHVNALPDALERPPEELLEAWFTLSDVAEAVAGVGARVTVVQAADRDAELEREGVRYRFVRTPTPSSLRRRLGLWATVMGPELPEAVRNAAPDVIHFHGLAFPRHVRRIQQILPGTPILIQDHGDGPPPAWLRALFRRGLSGIDGVSFTAPEQARPFRTARILGAGTRIFVNPESSSRFTPGDREEARAETGLHGDPCLLWLGHLNANKDPLTALEGLSRAGPELRDPQLWCAFRSAPLRDAVERRIARDPHLEGRVHLLGRQPRDRVQALLRAADFLVQGSHREGSGYAVIEALATGTPPIVTDIPPFRSLTGDGAVGFLFRPGDPEGAARGLKAAAAGDREALARNARRHFREHLSFEVLGARLVEAYQSLIAGEEVPGTNSAPDVHFRSHRPGDEAELVDLFRIAFGGQRSPEWWRWKLGARDGELDTVILGEDANGRLVFQMGGIPRRARVADREIRAMVAVDAMTHPEARRRGILTEGCHRLFDRWREEGVSLVLGLPNEQWGSRTQALGWRPLFPLRWRVRPHRPASLLARRLKMPSLEPALRLPGAAWSRLWDRKPADPELVLQEGWPDPGELDELSRRLEPEDGLIRDASWVRWRYREPPDTDYRLATARRQGRLEGFAAFRVRDEKERKIGFLAEVTATGGGGGAVEEALLHFVVRRLREERTDLTATLAPAGTEQERRLRRAGFLFSWGAFGVECVLLDDNLSIESLRDSSSFRLQGGDFDVV